MTASKASFREEEFVPIGDITWMREAACQGMDVAMFFPETVSPPQLQRLKKLCFRCPVRIQCLEYSIRSEVDEGWFGGVSPRDRARMAGRRKNV